MSRRDNRTARWVACTALGTVLLAGCIASETRPFATATSNQRATAGSTSRSTTGSTAGSTTGSTVELPVELPTIAEVPEGTLMDPLAGLPVTDSTASLLVSTIDEDLPTRLLELKTRSSTGIASAATDSFQEAYFADNGDAIYIASSHSLGVFDPATDEHREIDVSDTVDAMNWSFAPIDGGLAVTIQRPDGSDTQMVLLELDGSRRCAGPEDTDFYEQQTGELLSYTHDQFMDPTTCAVTPPLQVPDGTIAWEVARHGPEVFVDIVTTAEGSTAPDTIGRFDLATGKLIVGSSGMPGFVTAVTVFGGDVFVLAGGHLVKLDADTLETVSTTHVTDCDGAPVFVEQGDELYVLDDCSGTLFRIDAATGRPRNGWYLPHDDGSDIEIHTITTDDGIWMIDSEQTAVPYLFDTREDRFERMPISGAQLESEGVFADIFDVFPRTGD